MTRRRSNVVNLNAHLDARVKLAIRERQLERSELRRDVRRLKTMLQIAIDENREIEMNDSHPDRRLHPVDREDLMTGRLFRAAFDSAQRAGLRARGLIELTRDDEI